MPVYGAFKSTAESGMSWGCMCTRCRYAVQVRQTTRPHSATQAFFAMQHMPCFAVQVRHTTWSSFATQAFLGMQAFFATQPSFVICMPDKLQKALRGAL